jgi:hypothetical protein
LKESAHLSQLQWQSEAVPRELAGIVAGLARAADLRAHLLNPAQVDIPTSPAKAEQRSPSQRMPPHRRSMNSVGMRSRSRSSSVLKRDRAEHAGLGRLNRIMLVMNGRGWAREIVNLIDFDIERKPCIVAHQLE